MTREQFLAELKALGLTQGRFASLTGIYPSTVYHWGGAGGPFPQWVELLLAAWHENRQLESALKLFERRIRP